MSTRQAIGCTLLVTAIAVHFCFCVWSGSSYDPDHGDNIFAFVYAVKEFGTNTVGAGFWGIVVPVVVGGFGIVLLVWQPTTACADCGRQILQSATTCPGCGRPKPNLISCPHCTLAISKSATTCPHCLKTLGSALHTGDDDASTYLAISAPSRITEREER